MKTNSDTARSDQERRKRNLELNRKLKKLAPASAADLRDRVIELEAQVAGLKQQLKQSHQDNLKIQIDTLTNPSIYPSMKAGCIGEFTISVDQVCPECWNSDDDDNDDVCELCNNESDESSIYETEVVVPWTTQKDIFKMMCKYKAVALEQEHKENNYE